MSFGPTKIHGHSGTEFKHRNPYKKLKRLNKIFLFKYGDLNGGENNWIDKDRIRIAEKKKKGKQLTYVFGFIALLSCIIVLCIKTVFYLEITYASMPPKIPLRIPHGTALVEKDLENMPALEKGYRAWSSGDIKTAAVWFDEVNECSAKWWRKEYALMGMYGQTCKW